MDNNEKKGWIKITKEIGIFPELGIGEYELMDYAGQIIERDKLFVSLPEMMKLENNPFEYFRDVRNSYAKSDFIERINEKHIEFLKENNVKYLFVSIDESLSDVFPKMTVSYFFNNKEELKSLIEMMDDDEFWDNESENEKDA